MRWFCHSSKSAPSPKADAFLNEVVEVCKKHGFSISHEDGHGDFFIEKWSESNGNTFQGAYLDDAIKEDEG